MNDDLLSGALYILEIINPTPIILFALEDAAALANLICFVFVTVVLVVSGRAALGHLHWVDDWAIVVISLCIAGTGCVMLALTGLTLVIVVLYGFSARVLDGLLVGHAVGRLLGGRRELMAGLALGPSDGLSAGALIVSCLLVGRSIWRLLGTVPVLRASAGLQGVVVTTCIFGMLVAPALPDRAIHTAYLIAFPLCSVVGFVFSFGGGD